MLVNQVGGWRAQNAGAPLSPRRGESASWAAIFVNPSWQIGSAVRLTGAVFQTSEAEDVDEWLLVGTVARATIASRGDSIAILSTWFALAPPQGGRTIGVGRATTPTCTRAARRACGNERSPGGDSLCVEQRWLSTRFAVDTVTAPATVRHTVTRSTHTVDARALALSATRWGWRLSSTRLPLAPVLSQQGDPMAREQRFSSTRFAVARTCSVVSAPPACLAEARVNHGWPSTPTRGVGRCLSWCGVRLAVQQPGCRFDVSRGGPTAVYSGDRAEVVRSVFRARDPVLVWALLGEYERRAVVHHALARPDVGAPQVSEE